MFYMFLFLVARNVVMFNSCFMYCGLIYDVISGFVFVFKFMLFVSISVSSAIVLS